MKNTEVHDDEFALDLPTARIKDLNSSLTDTFEEGSVDEEEAPFALFLPFLSLSTLLWLYLIEANNLEALMPKSPE